MAFFKRKQKNIETPPEEVKGKEEEQNMTTLEQVRKAYEDLSDDDKKTFHQSLSDRVHESIAAQERADGNKDSQSAKDREREALGAEHADWGRFDSFEERLKKIEEALEARRENAKENREDEGKDKLKASKEKYGLSSLPEHSEREAKFTDKEINNLLRGR